MILHERRVPGFIPSDTGLTRKRLHREQHITAYAAARLSNPHARSSRTKALLIEQWHTLSALRSTVPPCLDVPIPRAIMRTCDVTLPIRFAPSPSVRALERTMHGRLS